MTAFERAWAFLQRLDIEGGDRVVDDPDDRGGLTRWGISQRAYPGEDIRNLTEERAKELFRRDYWEPCHCDELPPAVAIALADSAFNQGQARAVLLLQDSLRVATDGVIGPATLRAARRKPVEDVVNQFLSIRALRYLRGQEKYRRGWLLRLFRLKDALAGV